MDRDDDQPEDLACFSSRWLHVDFGPSAMPQPPNGILTAYPASPIATTTSSAATLDTSSSSQGSVTPSPSPSPLAHFWNVDLRNLPLSLPAESLRFVYSEHFLEHIPPYDLPPLLREVWRLLRPGGQARFSTPDLGKYVRGYYDGGASQGVVREHAEKHTPLCCDWEVKQRGAYSAASVLNDIMRNYGHRDGWLWDEDSLRSAVVEAGIPDDGKSFSIHGAAALSGVSVSMRSSLLESLDMEERKFESMYLIIVKP